MGSAKEKVCRVRSLEGVTAVAGSCSESPVGGLQWGGACTGGGGADAVHPGLAVAVAPGETGY